MSSNLSRSLQAVAIALLIPFFAIAQASQPVIENDHVRVKRIDLPHGESLPDDNRYDVAIIRLEDGETVVTGPGQLEKADASPMGDSHYFIAGTQRAVKNIGKRTVPFVEVQFLQPQGKYVAFELPPSHYCNPSPEKECVTERYLFCTDHFCAESVTLDPGAISTQHTHDADYIVVATSNFTWRNENVGKAPVMEEFKAGDAHYIPAGGSHRLVNTGGTTARLFVIQFK